MLADSRVAKTKLSLFKDFTADNSTFSPLVISKIVCIFFVVECGTNPTRMFNKLSPETREQIK